LEIANRARTGRGTQRDQIYSKVYFHTKPFNLKLL